ncbi:MAG TPA: hypothetical protein VK786_04690 [bacterium]|jgi:hypothetical protein|nr:hypothetical protein [bacterium]
MKSMAAVLALGLVLASRGLPADSGQSGPLLGQVDVEDAAAAPTSPAGAAADQYVGLPDSVDLSYHPVPATDALSLRQACWESLRISQVKCDGKVLRGGLWLTRKEAGYYYRNANVPLAVRLNRKALGYQIQGSVWLIASPLVGLVVGVYGGLLNAIDRYDGVNADGSFSYSDSYINNRVGQEALAGGAIGLVLGTALGIPMGLMDCRKAETYRQNAAETFNRKLLQDLQLYAVPKPGGGMLGVQKQF